MAKENELQFAISLKNEASATLAQFKSDAESAMKAAGAATEKYGQTTQNLTGWIKEQKAEQRQHNFLFAQGKEIVQGSATVLALFNATMGDSSEGMKTLSNSMNAGYVAFQGVNNVVGLLGSSFSFLAGPWGLAISLAAGAAVAFSQYSASASKSSQETMKLAAEANELEYRLGRISEAARKAFLLSEIVAAQDKVDALKKTTTDWMMQIMSQGRYGVITKTVGTPEEIAEAENNVRRMEEKFKQFFDATQKTSTEKSKLAQMREDLEKLTPGTTSYTNKLLELTRAERAHEAAINVSARAVSEKLTPSVRESINAYGLLQSKGTTAIKSITLQKVNAAAFDANLKKIQIEQLQKTLEEETKLYRTFGDAVGGTMQAVLGDKFTELLGNQNSILEIFLGQLGQNLIAWGAEQIATTVTNAIIAKTTTAATIAALSAEMAALSVAAAPAALTVNIASFGAAGAAAAASAGTAAAAQMAAMTAVSIPKFHEGGTMGRMGERQPLLKSDERPAIMKVGETVRTAEQERKLQQGSGNTTNIYLNFNAPVSGEEFIRTNVDMMMRKMGVTDITKVFVNQRSNLALSAA